MLTIGPYNIESPVILAPMAGVTDPPFRRLCLEMGAGMAVSEMITCDTRLWQTRKTRLRLIHDDETGPRSVQIVGGDPERMAEAARQSEALGARIIDINMGCPARKVCRKVAGSALLKDEALVQAILERVIEAVSIPVTLKIRTGWSPGNRNGITIARIAEDCGIQALAVHGRTRSCTYRDEAEYDTIAEICATVSIPVIANGDITSAQKARTVLDYTRAQAVMVGRAALGRPWIFREIDHFLSQGTHLPAPGLTDIRDILLDHLALLYEFHGELSGVRIARKHLGWYLQANDCGRSFLRVFNRLECSAAQCDSIREHFERLISGEEIAA